MKNTTFNKYYRHLKKHKKTVRNKKKELFKLQNKCQTLEKQIESKKNILNEFWQPETFEMFHGVLISVYDCGVSAPGDDFPRSARIYKNANDKSKYGCHIHQKDKYGKSCEKWIGAHWKDLNELQMRCKNWVVFGDVNYGICNECIVQPMCSQKCERHIGI